MSQADKQNTSYGAAWLTAYLRQQNFSSGYPCSVLVIGYGEDFLYKQGTLCLLQDYVVRIIDVHDVSPIQLTIYLRDILQDQFLKAKLKLNHFQDGHLSIMAWTDEWQQYVVLDVSGNSASAPILVLHFIVNLVHGADDHVFLHDARHLVLGCRDFDRHQWNPRGWTFAHKSLHASSDSWTKIFWLDGIEPVEELGLTFVMEIIDGSFWAVTSNMVRAPVGLGTVSFYGGNRCNLDDLDLIPETFRLFRRLQDDGPINDLWSVLRLSKSDDGKYYITEQRKQWSATLKGRSQCSDWVLPFMPGASSTHDSMSVESRNEDLPKPGKRAGYGAEWTASEEKKRSHLFNTRAPSVLSRIPSTWLEFRCESHDRDPADPVPHSIFQILHHIYEPTTRTSLDLVNLSTDMHQSPLDLRLRFACKDQEARYWPSTDLLSTHSSLRALFTPAAPGDAIKAQADERSLIFGACTGPDASIVLVSFDPSMDFVGSREEYRAAPADDLAPGMEEASWLSGPVWHRSRSVALDRLRKAHREAT